MSHEYIQGGNIFKVGESSTAARHQKLPAGQYVIHYNKEFDFWYFVRQPSFNLPKKLYGAADGRADRIFNTWEQRLKKHGKGTGVLLEGVKGSGKTLVAKRVANAAEQAGYPVIIVGQNYFKDDFKAVLNNLGRCVIIFDEFEKVYDERNHQAQLLTLFDGVYNLQALSFVIVNDVARVSEHMRERPGRFWYRFRCGGVSEEVAQEFCFDHLQDLDKLEDIMKLRKQALNFTFDHLQCLVEELNRYGETVEEASQILNIARPPERDPRYKLDAWYHGKDGRVKARLAFSERTKEIKDINSRFYISVNEQEPTPEQEADPSWNPTWPDLEQWVTPSNMVVADEENGVYVFQIEDCDGRWDIRLKLLRFVDDMAWESAKQLLE